MSRFFLAHLKKPFASSHRPRKLLAIVSVVAFSGLILDSTGNAADAFSLRVNAGGWASYTDASGKVWSKDAGFIGGTPAYLDANVANTADQELYRTERYGMTGFKAAVPNGTYDLTLGFSENAPWAVERIFNVSAENQPILTNFNIRGEVGDFFADKKSFTINVTDGSLDLGFAAIANNAKISTIELVAKPMVPATTTTTIKPTTTTALPVTTTTARPTTTTTARPATTTTTAASQPLRVTSTVEENTLGTGLGQVSYLGGWYQCGGCGQGSANNNYRYAFVAGNTATVRFTGTQAKFYGIKERHGGIASITVDGSAAIDVDTFAPTNSTSSLLFTTPVLSPGNHTLVIKLTGRKNPLALSSAVSFDKVDVLTGGFATTTTTTTVKATTTTAAPVTTSTTKAPTATTTTAAPAGQTASNTGRAPISPYWGTPTQWENFDGTAINNKQWYVYDSPASVPSRTASQVQVNGGMLNLVGLYNPTTKLHTSGGTSWNLGRAKYGKWEIRMRSDAGAGFSPTALLWPDSEVWPRDGEIDIFETGPWPDRKMAIAGVHNGVPKVARHKGYNADFTQWHTFGVEWTPTKVAFFLDGKVVHTETDPRYIPSGSSMHLALQNDTGCGWTECPNSTTKPITNMQIDYVSMWKMPYSQ